MGNMSYCRYRNTLSDLQDCLNAMNEEATDGGDLSYEEARAKVSLIELCKEIADIGDALNEDAATLAEENKARKEARAAAGLDED